MLGHWSIFWTFWFLAVSGRGDKRLVALDFDEAITFLTGDYPLLSILKSFARAQTDGLSCGKVKYGTHKHGWRKMLLCTWLHTYGLCHDAIGPCPSGNRGRSLQPCCTDWEHLLVWALLLQCRKRKGLIALAHTGSLLTRDCSVMPRFRCLKYWFSCPYYYYRKYFVE